MLKILADLNGVMANSLQTILVPQGQAFQKDSVAICRIDGNQLKTQKLSCGNKMPAFSNFTANISNPDITIRVCW